MRRNGRVVVLGWLLCSRAMAVLTDCLVKGRFAAATVGRPAYSGE
jgi:hypothetical protein